VRKSIFRLRAWRLNRKFHHMSSLAPRFRGFRTELVIFFLTFAVHAAVILEYSWRHPGELFNDEHRYIAYGWNLLLGSYVPDDNPDFVNGPGYPAVLAPFLAWGIPLIWARLLNALFIATAAAMLYRIVKWQASHGWGLLAAAWVALHMDVAVNGREAVTEALTLLLVTAVAGTFCLAQAPGRKGWWACVACGLLLACLAMTRVIFGHVIVVALVGSVIMLPFWSRGRAALVKVLCTAGLAFLLCLPYLAYTKAKTGRTFCWSTNSGELLFWMTRTHEGHNGCWLSYEVAMTHPELAPLYAGFFSRVTQLPVLQREQAFSDEAMKSLKTEPPARLAYNWVCNVCRLLVAYPTALKKEGLTSVAVSVFNAPFLVLVAVAGLLAVRRRRSLPPELLILFIVALIYTGGSTLATARSRYFVVITPIFWIASAAIVQRSVRLQWVPDSRANE
jgi:4-amino-4-deoxy-L-arabinose transferase-like glycosyltransferase